MVWAELQCDFPSLCRSLEQVSITLPRTNNTQDFHVLNFPFHIPFSGQCVEEGVLSALVLTQAAEVWPSHCPSSDPSPIQASSRKSLPVA